MNKVNYHFKYDLSNLRKNGSAPVFSVIDPTLI